ncbi:hypothetical protein GGR56DRAFT_50695 [Xylariaceae sp. FL0804]|nr:hypothetical protein GGR56DRAFT_50695 [Xylariaceae sp. FL0804]
MIRVQTRAFTCLCYLWHAAECDWIAMGRVVHVLPMLCGTSARRAHSDGGDSDGRQAAERAYKPDRTGRSTQARSHPSAVLSWPSSFSCREIGRRWCSRCLMAARMGEYECQRPHGYDDIQ